MLAPVEEIFCDIDDFCKYFLREQSGHILPNPSRRRDRESQMSLSEVATIIVLFQMSHYRTFKDYYEQCILHNMRSYFPRALSYTRFVSIQKSALCLLAAYLLSKNGKQTGLYYIDPTTLRVCHNKRIHKHKVFKNIAARSKSTMGWFYGFKLHLVVNHEGELMTFCLTKGNVDDRQVVPMLMKNLKGLPAGDKGYLGQD
jgi:Transposase DDE domain